MSMLTASLRTDTTKHSSNCGFSSSKMVAPSANHLSHGSLKILVKDWKMGACCLLQYKEGLNPLLLIFKRQCYLLWKRQDEWGKTRGCLLETEEDKFIGSFTSAS